MTGKKEQPFRIITDATIHHPETTKVPELSINRGQPDTFGIYTRMSRGYLISIFQFTPEKMTDQQTILAEFCLALILANGKNC